VIVVTRRGGSASPVEVIWEIDVHIFFL